MDVQKQIKKLSPAKKKELAQIAVSYPVFRMCYYDDPAGFVRDCFKWQKNEHPATYQYDVLKALPTHHRYSVRGPHGLGKTALAAWIILWFALTRDVDTDWKIPCTASVWRQLTKFLMPEVHKWSRRLNWDKIGRKPFNTRGELQETSLKLNTGEAFCLASGDPSSIEGAHATEILYVFDEAKTIPGETWDAAEGALSTGEARALAISTPGEPKGRFFEIQSRKAGFEDWAVRHVTRDETIEAGRMTEEWAEQRKTQWGENSAVYQNRVAGNFATNEDDGVIPLTWIEKAVERWHIINDENTWGKLTKLGVDVGRGGDPTVIARAHGFAIKSFEESNDRTIMPVVGRLKGIMDENKNAVAVIDVIGIGAGVVDRLREMKSLSGRIVAFNAGGKTHAKDKTRELGFANCLTEDARVRPVGKLLRLYRSRYQGTMYRVKTSSGNDFTTIPNHKVLTFRGWVSIKSLCVGDKLCNPSVGYPSDMSTVGPEVNQMIPKIGDVYSAAYRLFGAERMQSHTVNFHGDRAVDDVDVVTINRNLLSINPVGAQSRNDIQLVRSLLGKSPLLSQSLSSQCTRFCYSQGRIAPALPYGYMSRGTRLTLRESKPIQHKIIGFGKVSYSDATITEKTCNRTLRNTVDVTQSLDRLPAVVSVDNSLFVNLDSFRKTQGFQHSSTFDTMLTEYPSDYIPVNIQGSGDGVKRLPQSVSIDNLRFVNINTHKMFGTGWCPWLDIVFSQDTLNDIRTNPELVTQRIERLSSQIPLNDVISIDLIENVHDDSFVYTMETTTGAYYTTNAVHKNCRSWAWWTVRELLQDDLIALPPNDDMIGELTAPHYQMMSGGRIQVESKQDTQDEEGNTKKGVRARLGRSTNYADTVIQVFWKSDGGPSLNEILAYANSDITVSDEEDVEMDADIKAYMEN